MEKGGRKRVGLALGGGVVRGIAHLGVLAVLVEAGVPIDFISGTSVGALIAAAYASGRKPEELLDDALKFRWHRIIKPVISRQGFFSFAPLKRWIEQELGNLNLEDLEIPCAIVATDLNRGEPVAFLQGNMPVTIQASCSVPGLIVPVELGDRLLCDGGVSDMLPVAILREMGAEYVIAVDVFAYGIRNWLGPLGYLIGGLEILLERSGGGFDDADCLISPPLAGKTYLRFSRSMHIYELGRQAALEKLVSIQRSLGLAEAGNQGTEMLLNQSTPPN
jgi:NTE family protein